MTFSVIIPARLGSTRLPNKPLADIAGQPMIVRCAQQAAQSGARQVWVATDSPQVLEAVRAHGFNALLTDAEHPTGTDRLAQAARLLELPEGEIVVNVQGDEPLIQPEHINAAAELLKVFLFLARTINPPMPSVGLSFSSNTTGACMQAAILHEPNNYLHSPFGDFHHDH